MQEPQSAILKFLRLESFGGILLMASACLAMILANSPLDSLYQSFLAIPVETRFGSLQIAKPLLLWINDGLMAVFFFLVGLELKRELVEGELSDPRNIILPGVGAIGGMAIPALIYVYFNYNDPVAIQGWAIPAATDIAFALGVLTLLGSSVPTSIKIFLTSLAIFDDVGAIVIIAVFYTDSISVIGLAVVVACLPILYMLNRSNVIEYSPYMVIGIIMWIAMLKSGVHATLAGVLVAMFIPMRSKADPSFSPLQNLEHDLHCVVAYFVLPVFAFANAGINLRGLNSEQLLHSAPVGIALGLVVGKQLGIFSLCFFAVKSGITSLPKGMTFPRLYGTAALCGIGFTMSLFIGGLAFSGAAPDFDERIGIIAGSILSGVIGYIVLHRSLSSEFGAE
mgnify:FL=1|jgi:NhaA family Na+:H+ antiporter